MHHALHSAASRVLALAVVPVLAVALGLPAPVRAEVPDTVVEGYGSWQLRCRKPADAAADTPPQACEVTQAVRVEGRTVTQIGIGLTGAEGPLTMVVQVPTGIWLPAGVQLRPSRGADLLAARLVRCTATACIATLELDEVTTAAFAADQAAEGEIRFEIQAGAPVGVPILARGLSDALAALHRRGARP